MTLHILLAQTLRDSWFLHDVRVQKNWMKYRRTTWVSRSISDNSYLCQHGCKRYNHKHKSLHRESKQVSVFVPWTFKPQRGFKQYNFLLDISGHNIYYLSFYRSLQLLGDCCFEEKKRTGETFKYFVMQHGRHRSPNRSYNYAAFCYLRAVDIKPGSIWGHLSNTTLGKQTNDLFTVHIIVIPLNCHRVGEENGGKKLDKIQEQCYRKSSYGTCDSCLAVWSYHQC